MSLVGISAIAMFAVLLEQISKGQEEVVIGQKIFSDTVDGKRVACMLQRNFMVPRSVAIVCVLEE